MLLHSTMIKFGSILFGLFLVVDAAQLPSNFKTCSRSDSQFQECLRGTVEDAIKQLANGNSKLGVYALDPLLIPELKIGRGDGPVSLDLIFKNLKISGITDIKILSQHTDLDNMKMLCDSLNKKVILSGDYEIDGQILVIPIKGKGKVYIELENLNAHNELRGVLQQQKQKAHLDVKTYKYNFNVTKMSLKFDNLFNGDKALGAATNRILNENWREVLMELKPNFEKAYAEIFKGLAKKVFGKFPLESIYPK